jgi:uncharacterized lipoprotein YmbA
MRRTTWYAPSLIVALLAGGCGSSPPVHYYALEALESGYVAAADAGLRVGIGPLRAPDYLSRPQIVTRDGESRIIVDDFNRWAEPVDEAIYRIVAENVDSVIAAAVVVAFPYSHIVDLDYQVVGRIGRFDAGTDGTAVLQIQWGVIASGDEFVVQPRRARYEASVAQAGGYPALAHAMSEILQQFSRDVANTLESVIAQAGD